MQHFEQAGVHSVTQHVRFHHIHCLKKSKTKSPSNCGDGRELGVVENLMNVQFAVKGNDVYILEVNPRASRTIPFVSKCIGESLAKVAARCMAGQSLASQNLLKKSF